VLPIVLCSCRRMFFRRMGQLWHRSLTCEYVVPVPCCRHCKVSPSDLDREILVRACGCRNRKMTMFQKRIHDFARTFRFEQMSDSDVAASVDLQ
jgi:hypothetical protein